MAGRRGGGLDRLAAALIVALLFGLLGLLTRVELLDGEARVIDGDTIELAGRRIRLKGIDAPELGQTCERREGPYACGEAARAALSRLLAGQAINCRISGRDKYGRALAACLAGERDVAAILVRQGFALPYGGYETEAAEARADKAGLWAGTFEQPSAWRRARRRMPAGAEAREVRLRTSAADRPLACAERVPACGEAPPRGRRGNAAIDEAL